MRLPQIRMEQTHARLGLDIQKPVQELRQPRAVLNMKQEPAKLDIQQPKGQLTIDTSEAQANIDLRGPLRRTRDNADYGRRMWLEAIAKISSNGDRLAAIHKKGNSIADIAQEGSLIYEGKEILAAGSIVGDGVEIRYEAKKPIINVEVRGVTMDPHIQKAVHEYTPGKVSPYVDRWNSLKIDFVGLHVDQQL